MWFLILLVVPSVTAQPRLPFGEDGWRTDWGRSSIAFSELEVNVPRGAIPAVDSPRFISASAAGEWLADGEPVIQIRLGAEARAYPLQILTWHEIVNDEIEGRAITVTFCPLCYSAIAFFRTVDGEALDFAVSGMLRHSDLVMYDRQTHSLWQQLTGEALVGAMTGRVLDRVPAQIVSFAEFRGAFPEGVVLSRDTGHRRDYGKNPYVGYDDVEQRPWLFKGAVDDRLPPMEKVVGVEIGSRSRAYAHDITRSRRVINDELAGEPLVVFHTADGARSALDDERIAQSRVIGSTGVFSRRLGDRVLTFRPAGDEFEDLETRTRWNIAGRGVSGPLAGSELTPLTHADVFAFAWFVMKPETDLFRL